MNSLPKNTPVPNSIPKKKGFAGLERPNLNVLKYGLDLDKLLLQMREQK